MSLNSLLGQFGTKGSDSKSDSKYPTVESVEIKKVATTTLKAMGEMVALTAVVATGKDRLKEAAFEKYCDHNRGENDYTTSVVIPTDRAVVAHDMIVTYTEGYQVQDQKTKDQIIDAIGEEAFNAQFDEVFDISMLSKEIPEEKRQAVLEGLIKILTANGVDPSKAVKAKAGWKPKEAFNQYRTKVLAPTINRRLEEVLPTPGSVSEHKKSKAADTKKPATKKSK